MTWEHSPAPAGSDQTDLVTLKLCKKAVVPHRLAGVEQAAQVLPQPPVRLPLAPALALAGIFLRLPLLQGLLLDVLLVPLVDQALPPRQVVLPQHCIPLQSGSSMKHRLRADGSCNQACIAMCLQVDHAEIRKTDFS